MCIVKELFSSNDLLGPIELLYEQRHNLWLSVISIASLTVNNYNTITKRQSLYRNFTVITNKTLNRAVTDWQTTHELHQIWYFFILTCIPGIIEKEDSTETTSMSRKQIFSALHRYVYVRCVQHAMLSHHIQGRIYMLVGQYIF